jgi:hypothetical protein
MKALIAVVVAVVLGMAGLVVHHEMGKRGRAVGPAIDEGAEVATISTGDPVDVAAHVPRQGLTIIEFTAEF